MRKLDMTANPLTETQYYRENVFEKLTFLEALDGYEKDGSEWSLQDIAELNQNDSFEEIEFEDDKSDEEEGEEEQEEKEDKKDEDDSKKLNQQESKSPKG